MSFDLPEPIVDALLEKLGQDDDFRARFASNAREALGSLGFTPAGDASIQQGIWNCLSVTDLASKEAIRASHALLRQQLVARRASHSPIHLQVGPLKQKAA